MGQIPLDIVNQQIDLFGELVTITVKSDRTYSDWGDETATETNIEDVKAVYNVYNKGGNSNDEGKFQNAELTFFFNSSQTGLINSNKITRANGEVFAIKEARSHGLEGNTHVQEVLVEKV